MLNLKTLLFCLIFIICSTADLFSDNKISNDSLDNYFEEGFVRYKDYTYQEGIKTIKMYPEGKVLDHPVLDLNSGQKLILEFDDINEETMDYTYAIVHCSANWEPSNISVFDYMDGFEYNQIHDYNFSFNTYFQYINYSLIIPNEDVNIKLSGNYLIVVYNDDKPVLSRRFYVLDKKAEIEMDISRPKIIDLRNSHQEVDFNITSFMHIDDPYNDVKVIVCQNGRFDNRIENLKPVYIRDNVLIYDYQDENCFEGLNEFRYFNTKDIRFESHGIDSIRYIKPYYHFYLEKSQKRRFKVYFYDEELNGKYFTDMAGGVNMDTEADYVYVHFYLPYEAPMVEGNIFIFGELTDWDFTSENKMTYNFDKKQYECTLLLKQGYYNYVYAYYKDGDRGADVSFIEGSHYETGNDYTIYVYHREKSKRYDKLISVKTKSSIKLL